VARTSTRDEILSTAARLFAGAGFKGTSLQAIADEVGCSKATLLYHFDGKDAILTALLAPAARDLAALAGRLTALDPDAAQTAAIEGFAGLVVRYRREVALIFDELLNIFDRPAFEHLQPDIETLLNACAGPGTDPDRRLTAEVTLAGISAVVLNRPDAELPALHDALIRVARRTLVPRHPSLTADHTP
jgi:AcrR family transcriptional regulator